MDRQSSDRSTAVMAFNALASTQPPRDLALVTD